MISSSQSPKRPRRMARPAGGNEAPASKQTKGKRPSKLDQITDLLLHSGGTTLAELMTATNWQAHSVRGALAGALKRRGLAISSYLEDGVRHYCASRPA